MPEIRHIRASAPIRIADAGGWTDTWFARRGAVCNIAVTPLVKVSVSAWDCAETEPFIEFDLKNYGERHTYRREAPPGKYPLLEAPIEHAGAPDKVSMRIKIDSEAPPGASTGTSAAVTVALLAALHALRGRRPGGYDIAMEAHHIEFDVLRLQCGVQDQLASSLGGINFIEIDEFPAARVTPLELPKPVIWELDRRLLLVYLGAAHSSSGVHEKVIGELESEGPGSPRLERLRKAAVRARDALLAGDFKSYGAALAENTEAQADLHPELVSGAASAVIELARKLGAAGWKVNGAGGEGGSVTVLCGEQACGQHAFVEGLADILPQASLIPVRLSMEGVRVEEEFDA